MAKKLFDYFVDVKNKNGTSDRKLPGGYESWLNYWEENTKRTAEKCLGCDSEQDLHGSHVYIVGETAKEYIIPLCPACNHAKEGTMFSVMRDDLVRAV